jgi:hypothetical protein
MNFVTGILKMGVMASTGTFIGTQLDKLSRPSEEKHGKVVCALYDAGEMIVGLVLTGLVVAAVFPNKKTE